MTFSNWEPYGTVVPINYIKKYKNLVVFLQQWVMMHLILLHKTASVSVFKTQVDHELAQMRSLIKKNTIGNIQPKRLT